MRKGLLRGLADAPPVVVSSLASTTVNRNGLTWATGLDKFGFNYPLRAVVAEDYLGGNGEREAMYPIRSTDADGNALNGSSRYVVRLDRDPPSSSLLVPYHVRRRRQDAGPQFHRSLQDRDRHEGIEARHYGSITIPIQADPPKGDDAANWLPAPKGNFYVILRLYQPSEEIRSGEYELPQIRKVQSSHLRRR